MYLSDFSGAVTYPKALGQQDYYIPANLPNAQPWYDPIKGTKRLGYTFTLSDGRKAWIWSDDGPIYTNSDGDLVYVRASQAVQPAGSMRIGWTSGALPGTVVTTGDGRNTNTCIVGTVYGGRSTPETCGYTIAQPITANYYVQDPFASGYYEHTVSKTKGQTEFWVALAVIAAAPLAAAAISGALATSGAAAGTAATGAEATTAAAGTTAGAGAAGGGAAAAGGALPFSAAAGATGSAATAAGTAAAAGAGTTATATGGILATAKAALPLLKTAYSAYSAYQKYQQSVEAAKNAEAQAKAAANDTANQQYYLSLAEQKRLEAVQYAQQAGIVPGIDNKILAAGALGLFALFMLTGKSKRRYKHRRRHVH